jgi:hypothetical protein
MSNARDYLFAVKYPKLVLNEHPQDWKAGFFGFVFDKSGQIVIRPKGLYPIIEGLAASGRCPGGRVHGLWTNHAYNPREHDKLIFQVLDELLSIRQKFPIVDFEFSPVCESDVSLVSILDKCYARAGDKIRLVNSVAKGPILRNYKNEVHGNHSAPKGRYNYSTDGDNCCDLNIEKTKKTHARAEDFYYWHPADNGKTNDADTTPIPNRECYTTPELNDSIIYLHRPKGKTNLSDEHIWKSHADAHIPDPLDRNYKPVFITPVDAKSVELVADNNQVVAVMPRRGNFTDGRPMYRADVLGFILSEKARRIQGHAVVRIRANGKAIGTVNPAYRDGKERTK